MAYGVSDRSSCEDIGRKMILVGNARERDESCEAISGPRSPEQRRGDLRISRTKHFKRL
jgi:hypothetical protein